MSRAEQANAAQDAIERELADEVTRSHAQAKARGERIVQLADRLLHTLIGQGMLLDHSRWDDVRVAFFSVLADDLYGGASIDVPRLRRGGR